MELREKIAAKNLRVTTGRCDEWEAADEILAIPEIAEALAAKQREDDAKAQSDEYHRQGLQWRDPAPNAAAAAPMNLGASISTNRRDPV